MRTKWLSRRTSRRTRLAFQIESTKASRSQRGAQDPDTMLSPSWLCATISACSRPSIPTPYSTLFPELLFQPTLPVAFVVRSFVSPVQTLVSSMRAVDESRNNANALRSKLFLDTVADGAVRLCGISAMARTDNFWGCFDGSRRPSTPRDTRWTAAKQNKVVLITSHHRLAFFDVKSQRRRTGSVG